MSPKLHPMQDIVLKNGVPRFRENKAVRFLLEFATRKGLTLQDLDSMTFDAADRMQLAQLLGYSIEGYAELHYVTPEAMYEVDLRATELLSNRAKGSVR